MFAGAIPASTSTYTGQVGTRSYLSDGAVSYTGTFMEVGYTTAQTNITTLADGFAFFYVDGSGVEQNCSCSGTFKASIEYPPGTCTSETFASSSTGTIVDGALALADQLAISIPSGTKFKWRFYASVTGFRLVRSQNSAAVGYKDTANGDAINVGGSDQTVSCGSVTDSGATYPMFWPVLQVGPTTQPSVLILGNSRAEGYTDNYNDGAGFIGDVERSVGPYYGESNFGRSATYASQFVSSHTKRAALFPYFSTLIDEYGINDLCSGSQSAATVLSSIQTIAGYFTGPVFQTTLEPESTSTDGWATTGNQTTAACNSTRNTLNTSIRGTPTGFSGYFDVTSVVETSTGSGIWNAPGYTGDGVHELPAGNIAIVTANVIPSSAIHR